MLPLKRCTYYDIFHTLETVSSDDCPIGWKSSPCASACPLTCEDYLHPQLRSCAAVCALCECPEGMAVFRERCVDPLECYALVNGM